MLRQKNFQTMICTWQESPDTTDMSVGCPWFSVVVSVVRLIHKQPRMNNGRIIVSMVVLGVLGCFKVCGEQ